MLILTLCFAVVHRRKLFQHLILVAAAENIGIVYKFLHLTKTSLKGQNKLMCLEKKCVNVMNIIYNIYKVRKKRFDIFQTSFLWATISHPLRHRTTNFNFV